MANRLTSRDAGAAFGSLVAGFLISGDYSELIYLFTALTPGDFTFSSDKESPFCFIKTMEITSIYHQFHNMLLNYIRKHVSNPADADDILQNVFIKIMGSLDHLSRQEKLKSWVFTITRNAIIDYYRKNAGKNNAVLFQENLPDVLEEEDSDTSKGLEQCLEGFIDQLPNDYKDIIIDAELKGIKQKDLADKYDLAYPSVRSRVQRGRDKLKQMLHNCCQIELDSSGGILHLQSKGCGNDPCGACN